MGVKQRWNLHKRQLVSQCHHSIKLQRAWNKYGEDTFEIVVLMLCPPTECLHYEQKFIDLMQPEYNISPTAGSSFGVKRSEDFKRRCSASHFGKKASQATRRKMSEAKRGEKNYWHGKQGPRTGQRSHTKLTEVQVLRIRQALHSGVTIKALAEEYGVHRETISRIKRNVTWTMAN